ncbi:MAG: hypothetical protein P9M06_00110 [Candidatus Saelkia tenebricola]|nr:hypothetical protein [Candidatus Saelkia tenebricola]
MRKPTILLLSLLILNFSLLNAEELKIADFDRGEKPNLISGDYGTWNRIEWDRSQFCNESITSDPRIAYNGRGCSLTLDYDVDSPNSPAYNGFWMRLERMDLRNWEYLSFYAKGDEGIGYTETLTVEMKNIHGKIASFLVEGITSKWRKIVVPFEAMNKAEDFSEVYEFSIIFDEKTVTKKTGRIFIDEFYLYR